MQTKKIEYFDEKVLLEGYLAMPDDSAKKRPLILVAHDWSGRNEFACKKAEQLATEFDCIGFALDMFGKNVFGNSVEEKMQLITPLKQDRNIIRRRMLAALNAAKHVPIVDPRRIAIIGFCFGGLCALDLARSGADIKGVVSFHGLLDAPQDLPKVSIKAKILALHGNDDPMVPSEQVWAFEQEMTNANVDWQLHVFGNTKHAFTNPQAHDEKLGTVYAALADKRSWILMKDFFTEIL